MRLLPLGGCSPSSEGLWAARGSLLPLTHHSPRVCPERTYDRLRISLSHPPSSIWPTLLFSQNNMQHQEPPDPEKISNKVRPPSFQKCSHWRDLSENISDHKWQTDCSFWGYKEHFYNLSCKGCHRGNTAIRHDRSEQKDSFSMWNWLL